MELDFITATIAGTCMAICQVPQAVLIWRTGNTRGISVMMQTILTLGIAMWFVTGILLNNVPMYVSNGFCLVFCVYILYVVIRNNRS
ncbi:MAG: glutathione synthetase [Bacteroidaceae bacterium]|nr:glutathione synthetase [Bacteroidaceae bacterium]